MRLPLVAMFSDDAGQMKVGWLKGEAEFFPRFAASAGVSRFPVIRV